MSALWLVLAVICALTECPFIQGHTIHLGECPTPPNVENFQLDKLRGKWFAIKKSLPRTPCVTFNIQSTDKPGEYVMTETSQLTESKIKYRYSGLLRNLNDNAITLHYHRSRKHYNFRVVATDYDSYAAVYICNTLASYSRHSILVLSRNRTLSESTLKDIENKFKENGINMLGVEEIDQNVCLRKHDDGTFTEPPCYICASDLHTVTTDSPLNEIDDAIPLIEDDDSSYLEGPTRL